MKKFLLIITAALLCLAKSYSQAPDDILKYSYFPQHGTARNMAIGGAMGSLGGDINALYVNPAGLGLYKTGEVVLSPALLFNNNKFNFRGRDTASKKGAFDIGTSGFVVGFNTPGSKWTSQAFSIGINQSANFNNSYTYKGTNNQSSYTEMLTEEFSNSHLSIDQALNNPRFAFGVAPALYTYLIDTFRVNNKVLVKGLPEFLLANGTALNQQKTVDTKGGIYDIAMGYAANMDDKFYWGGSIDFSIVNYSRFTRYIESDPSGNTNNNFDKFELQDNLTTKGLGINGKIGLMFKPAEYLRLGLAIHTPTFYSLTDRESSDLTVNSEGYNGTASVNSGVFTSGQQGETKYAASTPWKLIASGSYVFREINDTRKQRAFVTADVEYVGYPRSGYKADGENVTSEDVAYYKDLKGVIKNYYKSAVNFRLGGELKFNTIMFRAGGAYYANPYKDPNLKSNVTQLSGGLGYRNHGIFVDLTYVHNINRDVNFPYRIADKPNTFAEQSGSRGNLVATVGFKF
jgi:hypothetical protein